MVDPSGWWLVSTEKDPQVRGWTSPQLVRAATDQDILPHPSNSSADMEHEYEEKKSAKVTSTPSSSNAGFKKPIAQQPTESEKRQPQALKPVVSEPQIAPELMKSAANSVKRDNQAPRPSTGPPKMKKANNPKPGGPTGPPEPPKRSRKPGGLNRARTRASALGRNRSKDLRVL